MLMKTAPEYKEGPEALSNFEETMKTLFNAPKQPIKQGKKKDTRSTSLRKPKRSDKD